MDSEKVKHPVYPVAASPERIETLKQATASLMAIGEAEMVALVPDRTGFLFMGCPDCDEGTQEGQLIWSVAPPYHVRCKYCGMVYPNEKYPEDRVLRVKNPAGVEVEYPYWEDETGYRYFFSARGWRAARTYLSSQAQDLGELCQATGDRRYARRAALILDAFARHYPGFLVSRDWPHQPKGFALEPPYPNGGGKWGRWQSDEMPTNLVFAYDAIYASGELERLSKESGADVKARIENDFFRGAIRQDGFRGPTYGNASPRIYEGYAAIGRVIGDPALVHEAARRSRGIFERMFFLDGFWCEGSVGYHEMTMHGMQRVFDALRGYSDPPDYVDPEDGGRFDGLDLERDISIIRRAKRIAEVFRYPDGRELPTHDNHAHPTPIDAPERAVSTLLAGIGHAWLGRGAGEEQVHLHLHFSGGYGHEHADSLDISLFAKGHELLSDLGYTHTRHRAWSTSTLCHNTVSIDEQRQYTRGDQGPSDGQLLAFETAFDPVQWMEASGERAYPGLARVYRRMVMLVDAGEGEVYVADLFRVEGGSNHDWALHGSADHDGTGEVSVSLASFGEHLLPGVRVRYPEGEADRGEAEGRNPDYAFFQNVARGEVEGGAMVTFTVPDKAVGVRTHLPGQKGAEVFLGDAISFRRAEENDALLDRCRMPIFLLRSEGPAPLVSRVVAVHEPYRGHPFVEGVHLETPPDGEGGVVLKVQHHGVTDHIVHRVKMERDPLVIGPIMLRGEVGFVRERDGVPETMGIWGGSELRWRDWTLTGSGAYEGDVLSTLRLEAGDEYDALVVAGEDLPGGEVLKGATTVVAFGDGSTRGYRVLVVKRVGGRTHVALEDDPGFVVEGEGMRHLFFPLREIAGPVTYRIRTSAFVTLTPGAAPRLTSVGQANFKAT
ncbi:MAG: hypothetical protein EXS64_13520 [Candidatus Latescibacteria bacterium]|nr:hypothetical protein [Candidatus Latescibacterota bacterium]